MTPAELLVEGLVRGIFQSAVTGVKGILVDPPGVTPDPQLVALSSWYVGLAPDDRSRVDAIIAMAADQATFGAAAVLDGSRRILPKGAELRVEVRNDDGSSTLTDAEPLIEKYRAVVAPLGRKP